MPRSGLRLAIKVIGCFLLLFSLISIASALLLTVNHFIFAYIKSEAYGVAILQILKINLLIFPYILIILIPCILVLSLALTIYWLYKKNFSQFYFLYGCQVKQLILAGMGCAFLFVIVQHILPYKIVSNLKSYILNELKDINTGQYTNFLEPLNFNHYKDWTLYIPDLPKRETKERLFAHIYKRKANWLQFIGKGYIRQSENGQVKIEEAEGYYLNRNGKVLKKEIIRSRTLFDPQKIQKDALEKNLARWRVFSASPELPFTNRGERSGYRYLKELALIQKMQKLMLRFFPAIVFLYLLAFIYLLKRGYRGGKKGYLFFALFVWLFFLLFSPYLIKTQYGVKPSFGYFYAAFTSGAFLLVFTRWNQALLLWSYPFFNFLIDTFRRELKPGSSPLTGQLFSYLFQKDSYWKGRFLRTKFLRVKCRLYLLFFWRLILFYTVSFSILFSLAFISRLYLHWQFNQGVDRFFWFFISQCLNLPEFLLSTSPYITAALLPFCLYLFSRNFLKNIFVTQVLNRQIRVTITLFTLILVGLSYIVRESHGYRWKALSREIYADQVLKFNRDKIGTVRLSYGQFIRLPQEKILFYHHASKIAGQYKLFQAVLNDTRKSQIISAYEMQIKPDRIMAKKGYFFDSKRNKATQFSQHSLTLNGKVMHFISSSAKLHDINTLSLKNMLTISEELISALKN